MEKYRVTGMSCAACSASVERAASKVKGVEKCSVNLLTETMTVSGDYNYDELVSAVENAGYGVSKELKSDSQNDAHTETKQIKKRLVVSLVLLVLLMYTAMGHNMLGLPMPTAFESRPVYIAFLQFVLSAAVLFVNKKFFTNGFKSAVKLSPNMDTLVALGSSVSFLYSAWLTVGMLIDPSSAHKALHGLYYESAAMILVLITVGKMLESRSKGKTTDALKSLIKLSPKNATLLIDGAEINVPIEQVKTGDIFVVRPGESIAADGVVVDGISSVNESALTGESIPVDKEAGDKVSAGTVNLNGFLVCKANRVGENTVLSQIIKTVSDAAATKAPIARIADKVSGVFVPSVLIISAVTVVVWLLLGKDIGYAIVRGISILVISCPCALGLATPVAIMVGNGVGARHGILFKNAEALENMGRVKNVLLDKTGTVTKGRPAVTDIIPFKDTDGDTLIKYAYSVEKKSEHPLALAVVEYAEQNGIGLFEAEDFKVLSGSGLRALCNGKEIHGGNIKYVEKNTDIDDSVKNIGKELAEMGKTPLYFSADGVLLGIIAVADEIKDDSRSAVESLKKMGLKVVMVTGDNESTANAVAKKAGIDRVIAGVLPSEKERVVRDLQKEGRVAMVGDGINDAPALTAADVGIAIGAGTDFAIDSADVVLMKSRLTDVSNAIKISRATLTNIKENLFWAFIYNALGIPLAAGVFISTLGWEMTPMLGALAMSLSSFCVVSNALRLNLLKLPEDTVLPNGTVLHIKGMMCEHCEKRVREILSGIDGTVCYEISHEKGTAVIMSERAVDEEKIKELLKNDGYILKKIEDGRNEK